MTVAPAPPPAPKSNLWRRLSLSTRAQIIAWSLFALIDLVNRQLTYQDPSIAIALTAMVYPILILVSSGLRLIYDRRYPSTSLNLPTFLGMALFSSVAAAIVVLAIVVTRNLFGWSIPHWRPLEEVALPFIHYAVVLLGWSILYFWIRSDRQRQIEHDAASVA